ncbi:MAG: hypothetical protein JXO22_00950 [Phycisphaerae bacterium]|nr:hypothetical protein [Phycisphaerae bacterium]
MHNRRPLRWSITLAAAVTIVGFMGCVNSDFLINNTTDISGDLTIVVNNDTPYIATFSLGTWNDLDRSNPREVNLEQIRMSAGITGDITLSCARNMAIGTQDFVDWVNASQEPDATDFEEVLLHAQVYFSDADSDTDEVDAPTVGTAEGIELLVGVHYSCDDLIVFTLVEDPAATGGFRIDYAVIKDEDKDAE